MLTINTFTQMERNKTFVHLPEHKVWLSCFTLEKLLIKYTFASRIVWKAGKLLTGISFVFFYTV